MASLHLISILIALGVVLCPQADEKEKPPEKATPEELGKLLDAWKQAVESESAPRIAAVLSSMISYDNHEFREAADEHLEYRASKTDRQLATERAGELGYTKKNEIAPFISDVEASVQIVAARLLSNFPDDDAGMSLYKAVKRKDLFQNNPKAAAGYIEALGRVGETRCEKDLEEELKRKSDPLVTAGVIRYFGHVKTKNLSIIRTLIRELDPPQPGNVDGASNPPASVWEGRWKAWNVYRRDVTWALKEITGQIFQPAEGNFPSDAKRALEYVELHKKELGLR